MAYVKPCGTCTFSAIWQFLRESVGLLPLPAWARYSLYVTVKAVLSGAMATAALPGLHPEPLTVATVMVILPVGGSSPNRAVAVGDADPARSNDATAAPALSVLSMGFPSGRPRPAMREHQEKG
ncbi:hypothetical protein Srufu_022900 [Streptomyces libani subsp. rufus]|nr:hypothetical protein Srufu_022900 [Streptomyces libani subsp. rufus]